MRRFFGAFDLILAAALVSGLTLPATAQTGPSVGAVVPPSPSPGRNVAATGRVMPPAGDGPTAAGGSTKASVANDMMKAQKAAAARDKAWDSKMRKTMGSICSGC